MTRESTMRCRVQKCRGHGWTFYFGRHWLDNSELCRYFAEEREYLPPLAD